MGYRNKKVSLNNKLVFLLASLILLVVISIGISVNIVFQQKFASYVSLNNQKEIKNIIASIEAKYEKNKWNKANIKTIGEQAINKGIIIDVYDKENNLIWDAMQYNGKLCHQTIDDIENNMNYVYPKWNGKYTVEKFNLYDRNGNYIGYINIGSYNTFYYMDNEINFLKEINQLILLIGVITIIITITIAVLISNNISKPIEKVSKITKQIGEGRYSDKIEYKSNIKEIDTLIYSINNLEYKLKEQESLRKRLTTDISHELRTPLTSIQTHLEALIDGIWEPTNDRLNSINEEVIRLTSLVNQLKNLAKFDSEKAKLRLSLIDLEQLIKNIIYNNQGKALEKNIRIISSLDCIYAYLDKEKISQLIVNLLSNGIRYSKEGGSIYIKSYIRDNNIKIHFIDNGIGIPQESIDYIFERFYRVDESRNKKTGGIGVGLTISKSIVELHKGSIEVNSKLNKGSEFIVSLPINLKNS